MKLLFLTILITLGCANEQTFTHLSAIPFSQKSATNLTAHHPGARGFHCFMVETSKTKDTEGMCFRTTQQCQEVREKNPTVRTTNCRPEQFAYCFTVYNHRFMSSKQICFTRKSYCEVMLEERVVKSPQTTIKSCKFTE